MIPEMSRADRERMYAEFLAAEGFRPDQETDDFVMFVRAGRQYGISVDDDAECFVLSTPILTLTEDTEPHRLRAAALRANDATRVAKLYVDDRLLIATVQQFCNPPESFRAIFSRCLTALDEVATAFTAQLES